MKRQTQSERARRIQELYDMDRDAYNVLLERVRHSLYDPEIAPDAMQFAYTKALTEFDGRVPYANYILTVAHNYAYHEWLNHGRRQLLISDIEQRDPELQTLGTYDDPPPEFDEISFADEVLTTLFGMEVDPFVNRTERADVERTMHVFKELTRSAVAGYGPGVDEYEEQAEQSIPEGAQRRMRRTRMLEHLATVLTKKEKAQGAGKRKRGRPSRGVGVKSVEASMTLLRKVVRPLVYEDREEAVSINRGVDATLFHRAMSIGGEETGRF